MSDMLERYLNLLEDIHDYAQAELVQIERMPLEQRKEALRIWERKYLGKNGLINQLLRQSRGESTTPTTASPD